VPLFNPRLALWDTHFAARRVPAGFIINGITPTGRATVDRLVMNEQRIVSARVIWSIVGLFPP
jgi:hypothetical protein